MFKRLLVILLCAGMMTGVVSCSNEKEENVGGEKQGLENVTPTELPVETPPADEQLLETVNLMDGVEPLDVVMTDIGLNIPVTKFGMPLFQNALSEADNGENVLISPLSAWMALCMTEVGAEGETKNQMQEVLGISGEDYHAYVSDFMQRLSKSEYTKVHLANGIWYKNVPSLHVQEKFLQYNKTWFDATAYKAPFNQNTLNEINQWVSENTDGMIPGILEEIKEEDVMYLVNALSFDAEWQNIYKEDAVWNDTFTTENGEEQLVSMLHSDESFYLEDACATGFMKYYKGREYAFVALLPKKGMTVAEYVADLSAENLNELLEERNAVSVEVTMPKFSVEYGFSLNDSLKQMGMVEAFLEDDADFGNMATSDIGNIYISQVNQKCFIAVDGRGTKAGAATAVAMANKMMAMEKKVVNLNRPFVYLIIECEHNEPLFMGTMMKVPQ